MSARKGGRRKRLELIDAAEIREGAVFVRGDRMRRVIAVLHGYVRYSRGGDTNFTCRLDAFRKFATPGRV